jgi:hypothetical protein
MSYGIIITDLFLLDFEIMGSAEEDIASPGAGCQQNIQADDNEQTMSLRCEIPSGNFSADLSIVENSAIRLVYNI